MNIKLNEGFKSLHGFGNNKGIDNEYAYKCFLEAKLFGSVAANIFLGDCCENGIGTKLSVYNANIFYKEAIKMRIEDKLELEDGYCLYALALMFHYGKILPKNEFKAIELYKRAIDKNISPAFYELGTLYEYGSVEVRSNTKAFDLYLKGSELKCAWCEFGLSMCFFERNGNHNNQNGLTKILQSANQNYLNAQTFLGHLYFYGNFVDQDYQKSIMWYQKAANRNDYYSQFELGEKLFYGNGFNQNISEGLKWLTKSAECDYIFAQYKLVEIFFFGHENVEINKEQVLAWAYYVIVDFF